MHQAQAYHYVGLDIHKRTVSYCEKTAAGTSVSRGTIASRAPDLIEWAQSRPRPWVGAMEATIFSGWIYDTLAPHAIELHVGHPLRLKAMSKNKSDKIDAEMLANLLRADLFPSCHMASPQVRELRRVLRYRNLMVREATRMKNRAAGILMEIGAEYSKAKLHRKRYFSELLDGLAEVPSSVLGLLKMTRSNIEVFARAQQELLDALARHDALSERVARLKTVGGVGDVTALTWALEIDDPNRFGSIKDVQSYCGLCSARHESAGKERRAPLSKERNPNLQHILIEAAKLAPANCDYLRRARDDALSRGYNRNRATLHVARKMAAYLLAVDKSSTDFVAPVAPET
jgi:transposase